MSEIISNIKLTTWLKNELLASVSDIFIFSESRNDEQMIDAVSRNILACYLLARRLGIDMSDIEQSIGEKIKLGILNDHICEKKFKDLSYLSRYIRGDINESGTSKRC